MSRYYRDLIDRPGPGDATLLGCGPSLDSYDDRVHGAPLVIGVNYAAAVARCNWGVYLDDTGADIPFYPGTDIIRPIWFQHHHNGLGWYYDWVGMPEGVGAGTAVQATWFAHQHGVKRILYVGMDSVDHDLSTGPHEYADAVSGWLPKTSRHTYKIIIEKLLEFIELWGIEARWLHRGESW